MKDSLQTWSPIDEYRDTTANGIITYLGAEDYPNTETTSLPWVMAADDINHACCGAANQICGNGEQKERRIQTNIFDWRKMQVSFSFVYTWHCIILAAHFVWNTQF